MKSGRNTPHPGYSHSTYVRRSTNTFGIAKVGKGEAPSKARSSLGSVVWIAIGGIIPVYRFVAEAGFSWLPQAIILLLLLLLLVGRVRALPHTIAWVACAVAILAAGAISGTSSDLSASLRAAVGLAVLVGVAPFVLNYYFQSSPSFGPRIANAFLCVQSVSAVAALAQVAGLSVFGAAANSGRANGLAGHPNVQGLMCVIALVLLVAMFRSTQGTLRAAVILAAMVNAGALVATGSLSSLLSLAAATVVLIVVYRAAIRSIVLGVIVLAGTAVVLMAAGFDPTAVLAPVNHRIDVVTGESVGVASLGIRQQTYAFAWEYIQNDPLVGVGMDSTNQGTFNGVTVVHNYVLHAWYQGGLALLLAMAGVTLLVIGRMVRTMMTGAKGPESAIMAAVIVYALGSAFFDQQQYWIPLILAFVASYYNGRAAIPATTNDNRLNQQARIRRGRFAGTGA